MDVCAFCNAEVSLRDVIRQVHTLRDVIRQVHTFGDVIRQVHTFGDVIRQVHTFRDVMTWEAVGHFWTPQAKYKRHIVPRFRRGRNNKVGRVGIEGEVATRQRRPGKKYI